MVKNTDISSTKFNRDKIKTCEPSNNFVDSLHLQDVSQQLEELKENIFNKTENNETKIAFIKEEIASGRYQIYEEQIATKFIEFYALNKETEPA